LPSCLQKQVVYKRKTRPDSDSDGGENHACSGLHKLHLFVGCYSFSASQVKYIFFNLYPWSPEVIWEIYTCRCYMYFWNKRHFLISVAVLLIKHWSVPRLAMSSAQSAWVALLENFRNLLVLFRHRTIPSRVPYSRRSTYRIFIDISHMKTKNINTKIYIYIAWAAEDE